MMSLTTNRLSSFLQGGIMFVFATVPLVFWHGVFFPYTFIKTILFYVLVDLLFGVWMVLAVAQKEYRPRLSIGTGAMAVFLFFMGIASVMGVDASKSVWSDYERMFGFITWLHAGVFFLVLSSVIRKDMEWRMVWRAVLGTAAVIAIIAVWQGFTTSELSVSTIGNAAYLSSYITPMFFLVCMFALQEERFTKRVWLYIGLLLLFSGALVFTQARAGIVGLLGGGGIGVLLFLFFGNSKEYTGGLRNSILKKWLGVIVLFILMLFGSVVFLFPDRAHQLPRPFAGLLDFSLQNRTTTGRFLVWNVAWEGWKERLLFGWGPENFATLFNTYYQPELYAVEPWFDRAHNFIFDIGTTMGIAGLFAYLGMFGAAFSMLIRKWKGGILPFWHMAMLGSLLGAHLVQNLFTFDTISSLLVIVLVLGYSNAYDANRLIPWTAGERELAKPRFIFVSGAIAIILVGTTCYFTAVRPLFANAAAHRGWELLRTGGGDEAAVAQFEKSISYGTRYSVDARRFVAEYVFEFLKQAGKRPDVLMRPLMEYAVVKMDENIAVEPYNVKWIMYRGELYSLMAQKFDASLAGKAEEDFLRARDISSGRPQIYLELAQARKMQGDNEGAWKHINYVTDTIPDFVFGHLNAVVLAIETEDRMREKQEIEWFREREGLNNELIRDVYFKRQRYKDAAYIQELLIASAATEPQTYPKSYRAVLYEKLAVLYKLAGDAEHAREAAIAALTLDPTQKNEVEAFLQSLQ